MKLKDKAIVVTGASSGMGKAIVELFVKEGANVVAVARRADRLASLAESLKGEAGKCIPFTGDVSRREDCEAMIDECVKQFGKLDVLVNNAGVMDNMATVANCTDEKYEYVMGINVYGPLAAMRKAVNVFLEQGSGGNIITISSFGAYHQAAGVIYCASKAAVNAIALEIGVAMGQPDMDGFNRIKGVQSLMPASGEPIDVANCALFLASDDSSFISGQIIGVDGGWAAM